jgi:hypothetical protein
MKGSHTRWLLVFAVVLLGFVTVAAPAAAGTRQTGAPAPSTTAPTTTQSTPEGKAAAIAELNRTPREGPDRQGAGRFFSRVNLERSESRRGRPRERLQW